MPLPSSGNSISISQIRNELIANGSSYSLRQLSAWAGKSTPDAMSEFYGYSNVSRPSGMTARYDAANYSGGTIADSTGNGYTMSLSGVTYVANSGNPYIQTAIGSSNQSISPNSSLSNLQNTISTYAFLSNSTPIDPSRSSQAVEYAELPFSNTRP